MTQTFEALSRRHDTLASIRGIVHTMKTISAINSVPYEHAARSVAAYHATVISGLQALLTGTGRLTLPARPPSETVVVVFGSDHGLCGNYNELLADRVAAWSAGAFASPRRRRILCVGSRMGDALRDRGLAPDAVLLPPASVDGIGRLAGDIVTRLDAPGHGPRLEPVAVSLAFTRQGSGGQQEPVVSPLIPLSEALLADLTRRRWASRSLPVHTLASDRLFASLVRSHIFASVFHASAEAIVTENAARLARMQQAEKSVDERLDEVSGQLRSGRQEEITTELLDVIIGFEALQKSEPG